MRWERTEQVIRVPMGQETVRVLFSFRNTGRKPLRILRFKTSCTCIQVGADQDTYAPDEKGTITALLRLPRSGTLSKTIYVKTDSPDLPLQRLTVTVLMEKTPSGITLPAGKKTKRSKEKTNDFK